MPSTLKSLAFLVAVGAAVMVPLSGDPRTFPVTHAEWARMLLRALALDEAVPFTASASQAFSILTWRGTLAYQADRYLRADGIEVDEGRVVAKEGTGEVAYPLAVVRVGDYRVRARIAGDPALPATAEITRLGETKAVKSFTLVPASVSGWIDAGSIHLDPGVYTASLILPGGTSLENVEVSPPCVDAIEPQGGWKATAVLLAEDVAVTSLEALDLESELPPSASPIEVSASDFQTEGPAVLAASSAGPRGLGLKAGAQGLRAVVFLDLPEAGLYTISVFGLRGNGQRWLADACRKAILCSSPDAAELGPEWHVVMTSEFTAGRHFLSVNLGPGAGIERVRAERKKDGPADYVATLKRVGFDVGPSGPVNRDRAVDAMKFIETKRAQLRKTDCGDVVPPTLVAETALAQAAAPVTGPGAPPPVTGQPPFGGGEAPQPLPLPAPVPTPTPIPTQPPGSPTEVARSQAP